MVKEENMGAVNKLILLLVFATLSICGSTFQRDSLMSNLQALEGELAVLKDELSNELPAKSNDELIGAIGSNNKIEITTNEPEEKKSFEYCGFEDECIGAFKIEPTTPVKWDIVTSNRYLQDRTDPQGHFLHVEIKKENKRDEYAYFSHELTVNAQQQCGEFYYHMYNRDGCDVARLLVTLECEGSNETQILMRETGNRQDKWHRAALSINRDVGSKCKLTWRVSKGLTEEGKVSIDDLTMRYEACRSDEEPIFPSQADCSFHKDTCSWKKSGSMDMRINSWGTSTRDTGPDRYFATYAHHTYGRYLYLEADDHNPRYEFATTNSYAVNTTKHECENRHLLMSCSNKMIMKILTAAYGRQVGATGKCGTQQVQTRCHSASSLRIVREKCEGRRSCTVHASNRVFGDPCGGTYKYLEVTYQCQPAVPSNDVPRGIATLASPKMKSSIDQCMRFMYNMHGAEMGSLKASVNTDGVSSVALNKSGDQGKAWHEGWLELPANKENQVTVAATVGDGVLSDIALSDIKVQPGKCSPRKTFASCTDGDSKHCSYTDETCGEEVKEVNRTEEFTIQRNQFWASVPKMSKEWELSFDIKLNSRTHGWTNIIKFTTTGINCCNRGDRIPAIFVYSNTNRMHITNAIDWNGNYNYNEAYIQNNKYTNVKLEQVKKDDKYYFNVYTDGQLKKSQLNRMPQEWKNVKMFTSDNFHNPANAQMKNLVFKNTGAFDACNEICNKKLSDEAFTSLVPAPPTKYTETFSPKKDTLKGTIAVIAKQWSLSLDIKPKGIVSGWTNIIRFTADDNNNCCSRGSRIPAIWFWSRTTKLHICNTIDNNGNRYYNPVIPMGSFTTVLIQQKKVGTSYRYSIALNGTEVASVNNTIPREWKNVKVYGGDRWYNPANVDIRNVEFKNLVPTYPCHGMCKGKDIDDVINGEKVNAVSYDAEHCIDESVRYEVNIPQSVHSTRGSCLKLYYKVPAISGYLDCGFKVMFNGHQLEYIRFRKDTHDTDVWHKFKKSVSHYIPFGSRGSTAGVHYYANSRCPNAVFANLQLLDGVC